MEFRAGSRFLAAALLSASLVACKETAPADKTTFQGGGIVSVLDVKLVPSSDSSNVTGASSVTYVLAKIEIKNDQPSDWSPDLSHVYLLDRNNNRYPAITSGSSTLIGVSNDLQPIKKGEKKTYTVAFRTTDPTISGSLGYDY